MTEVQPFRLPSRERDRDEVELVHDFYFQRNGADSTIRDLFLKELSERYPHDTRLQPSQTRHETHFGECLALSLLPGVSNGPPEAFLDFNPESREFLFFSRRDGLSALYMMFPNDIQQVVVSSGWGVAQEQNLTSRGTFVFLPRSASELETVFSIIFESYIFAKGSRKFVIPNGLNLPRVYGKEEEEAVLEVVRSGFMSRYSNWDTSKVHKFEKAAAEYLGVKHCLMLNSGTAGLVAALAGLNIGPGDEVLVSCFTWISTAAAVIAVGAVPIMYDIDESLGPNVADLRKRANPRTKAIIVTHMMGSSCHMDDIVKVVRDELKLKMVEDCCQSVGGKYKGQHIGTFGDAGVWSMNYHKNICVGEGGLLFTSNRDIYERAWSVSEPAFQEPHTLGSVTKSPEMRAFFSQWSTDHFVHSTCRGSELAGALGLAQLPKLDPQLNHTRQLRQQFIKLISEIPPKHFRLQPVGDEEGDCGINVAIILHPSVDVSTFVRALKAEQIGVRPIFTLQDRDNRVYYWWDSILQMKGMSTAGYPWKDAANSSADSAYSLDMCSASLEILKRTICFSFAIRMNEEHVRLMAAALRAVDQGLP